MAAPADLWQLPLDRLGYCGDAVGGVLDLARADPSSTGADQHWLEYGRGTAAK
ncbi:MAG TPA: hypothetical protein VFA63_04735 [Pseudonocardiaceae bacterium]|nr:hypothetical protein [Pseudonocardiaceae bacterium]